MSEPVVEALGRFAAGGVTGHGLDRGGRVLCWVRAGCGDTPVVFVDGAGETLLDWANVLPEFAAHIQSDTRTLDNNRASHNCRTAEQGPLPAIHEHA